MPRLNCRVCDKDFYVKPSHLARGWGKYCSKTCNYKARKTGAVFSCFTCSKEVYKSLTDQAKSESGRHFCGKSCQTVWRNSFLYAGKNHANWKSGEASYRSILLRSGTPLVCTKCQSLDKRVLAVHHKDRNRKNNAVSNLIWLCHNCHFLVHHDQNEAEGFVVPVA